MSEITYKEGPTDRPWELATSGKFVRFVYVQRQGWDEREPMLQPPYEVIYGFRDDARDVQSVASYLRDRLNELDRQATIITSLRSEVADQAVEISALSAWACQGCGARFATPVPPTMLAGVTHCSKCVEVEVVTAYLSRTRATLRALCRAVEAERAAAGTSVLSPSPTSQESYHAATVAVDAALAAAREVIGAD